MRVRASAYELRGTPLSVHNPITLLERFSLSYLFLLFQSLSFVPFLLGPLHSATSHFLPQDLHPEVLPVPQPLLCHFLYPPLFTQSPFSLPLLLFPAFPFLSSSAFSFQPSSSPKSFPLSFSSCPLLHHEPSHPRPRSVYMSPSCPAVQRPLITEAPRTVEAPCMSARPVCTGFQTSSKECAR